MNQQVTEFYRDSSALTEERFPNVRDSWQVGAPVVNQQVTGLYRDSSTLTEERFPDVGDSWQVGSLDVALLCTFLQALCYEELGRVESLCNSCN